MGKKHIDILYWERVISIHGWTRSSDPTLGVVEFFRRDRFILVLRIAEYPGYTLCFWVGAYSPGSMDFPEGRIEPSSPPSAVDQWYVDTRDFDKHKQTALIIDCLTHTEKLPLCIGLSELENMLGFWLRGE